MGKTMVIVVKITNNLPLKSTARHPTGGGLFNFFGGRRRQKEGLVQLPEEAPEHGNEKAEAERGIRKAFEVKEKS